MMLISNLLERFKGLSLPVRIMLSSCGGLLVLAVLFVSLVGLLWPLPRSTSLPHTGTGSSNAPLSPLLFGTNLNLLNNSDQVLTSAATRDVLQQIHPQSIRLPLRSNLSPATVLQAAQIVKSLGATPVVTLQGALDSAALSDDTSTIKTMNQVFGESVIYYEFGNEDDLMGLSAERYTHSWNALVPLLKSLAPQAKFIGPVTYRYDQQYLSAFLHSARPRPDGISWHEYTCVKTDPEQTCLSHLNEWSTHIASARTVMNGSVGTALPVLITEWNYAPDASATDGKSSDATFMSTWTQKAFQTLVSNRVFASMQYSCTNTPTPLVSKSNDLTTQGAVFMSQYQHAVAQTNTSSGSPTASVIPTATASATPTASPTATATPATQPTVVMMPTTVAQPTTVTQPTVVPTVVTTPPGISTPVATPTATTAIPTAVATPQPTVNATATVIAANKTPLYRLYSSKYGNHFYTISASDRDDAVANNSYTYEGIAAYVFKTQVANTVPLYWLYSTAAGDDFYTTSASERDTAIAKDGYQSQGIAAYVYSTQVANSVPLYRLYSSKQGDHFYTISASERDTADSKDSYTYEGIACYVLSS